MLYYSSVEHVCMQKAVIVLLMPGQGWSSHESSLSDTNVKHVHAGRFPAWMAMGI